MFKYWFGDNVPPPDSVAISLFGEYNDKLLKNARLSRHHKEGSIYGLRHLVFAVSAWSYFRQY